MLHTINKMDIYLFDQLLKGRILPSMKIFDAGCGWGRNSEYFIRNNYNISGVDLDENALKTLKEKSATWNPIFDTSKYQVADLVQIPFPDESFDYIISSAVLHFSKNRQHFIQLFDELVRVMRPEATLWFRMTTKHTIEHLASQVHDDVYNLPDGSTRYLLDRILLAELMEQHHLIFVDPFKTVNVNDIRTMATVVLKKN